MNNGRVISGTSGDDVLFGDGESMLVGGLGNDRLVATGRAHTEIALGPGNDVLDFSQSDSNGGSGQITWVDPDLQGTVTNGVVVKLDTGEYTKASLMNLAANSSLAVDIVGQAALGFVGIAFQPSLV